MQSFFAHSQKDDWLTPTEGQLSVDVLESSTHIYVRSIVAGVPVAHIDIQVTSDTITIRGERTAPLLEPDVLTHVEECFWGTFSRSIVLPNPVIPEETLAELRLGILTISLKKAELSAVIPVKDMDALEDLL